MTDFLRPAAAALSLALVVAAQAPDPRGAALLPLPDDRRPGFESIDPEQCREWLTYLASDELSGRATGHPGYEKAARFVAARFAEFGLKPVADDGTYFQDVPFFRVVPDPERSHLAVVADDGAELLRVAPGEGLGGRIAEKSDQLLDLVALTARSAEDVDAADVEGKAVLFFDHSPEARRGTEASFALRRARPAAVLTVDDPASAEVDVQIQSGGARERVASARFRRPNSYAIASTVAAKMLEIIDDHEGAAKLRARIEVRREPVFGANVIGLFEGSDPKLKHEIVGIGAHLDHIGARGEVINNGADDDGSGTTGVLAVARAFAENPKRPRRSILFMCFSGEERGLVGSRYYADHPIFPNQDMVAELQMDMIGRREERVDRRTGEVVERPEDNVNSLHLVGTQKLSEELHDICLAANRDHVGFDFEYDEEDVFSRSDHVSFARKDIPIAFFFTGFHPQYHRPDDTVEKIDFPKLARVAQLVYAIAFEVAERDERPKRDRRWADIETRRRRR